MLLKINKSEQNIDQQSTKHYNLSAHWDIGYSDFY